MATRFLRMTYVVVVGLVVFMAQAPAARAEPVEDPVHIDEMAALAQARANSLCWEMHRYHRHQPDFAETYRMAKEVWTLAGALRDLLRSGPVDAATIAQHAQRIGEVFEQVERRAAKWEGLPMPEPAGIAVEERGVVVTPRAGLEVDVPFFGLRLATPSVSVMREDPRMRVLERRRPHPNSRGSTRNLQRELDSVKIAVSYLLEDTGAALPPQGPPQEPPQPAPSVDPVLKISPPAKAQK